MKICIPTMGDKGLDEQVGEHFGRVPTYTIYNTDTKEIEIVKNVSIHVGGGSGYAPELIAKAGANIMVCGGLGRKAIGLFEQSGIMVYVGASGTVKEALDKYENGQLQAATDENACAQHAFRGEGVGDGHGKGHHHHD